MKKILITLLVIVISGCSSSKITTSWRAEDTPAAKYSKVMVIGLMKDNDVLLRTEMESHLVGDLEHSGIRAYPAYHEFGAKAFVNADEKKMLEQIRNKGFDGVMTIVLLSKQQEKEYIPGRVIHSPYYIHQGRLWNYYHTMYARIETEGYYTTRTRYFWESNFYDMATRKLVYSVHTETFDPANTRSMAHEYGKLIVKDMIRNKVIDTVMVMH